MERYIMFVDWDNQYCQNESNTQCNLQIQCNPYQKNFRIFIKAQKTPNSQSNLEKKHGAGKIRLPDFTHGHHRIVNTEIRLIIFFAPEDGEALQSQQKQDQELTVAQIMNSLLSKSDLNCRK